MIRENPARRTLYKVGVVLGALTMLAAGAAVFAYPAMAAAGCPICYGFVRIEPNVFVERSMSSDQRAHVHDVMSRAFDRVAHVYGDLTGRRPRVLICSEPDCYRRVGGGGSRGMAWLDIALFLSPGGIDPVIASHELAHIEMHQRLGLIPTFRRAIPQWFDEGVAVVISDDPRYLASADKADRCLVAPEGALPSDRAAWIQGASNDQLYEKAACRVSRWIAEKGGTAAVTRLIGEVAAGTDFETAYNR